MRASLQGELEPANQPEANRLVVGSQSLKIEHFVPVGDVRVDTPSGRQILHHAATAEVRCAGGSAEYLFGEIHGHLMGARTR
jgi:hypothetical protein